MTGITGDGTIIPAVNYFDQDEARDVIRRKRTRKVSGKQRRSKVHVARHEIKSRDKDYIDVTLLELELDLIRDDDNQKIIFDDKSQEEIIIDEILSMPIDSLLRAPKVRNKELLWHLAPKYYKPITFLKYSTDYHLG